jgi:hypothetical protein
MRVHLRLFVLSAVAAGDGFNWGIIVAPQSAMYANQVSNAANVWSSVFHPNREWMFIRREGAHPGYSFTGPNNQFELDIKSRRVVKGSESTLAISIDNTGAAASLNTYIYARLLLALP